jgi:hypothetical protein
MSQTITAATIRKQAFSDRLGLYVALRRAALNPKLDKGYKRSLKLAARWVIGSVDNADYDIMARLQLLEGATGSVTLGKNAGTWWKKGRRGLKDATDAYVGTDLDPSWLSTQNTGMIGKVLGMIRQRFNSVSRGQDQH